METDKSTQRPNFFILLGLSPHEEWNLAKFDTCIKQKQVEWTRQSTKSIGQRASQARRNLELLTQIRDVMDDEKKRAQESKEAVALLASEQTVRLESFETQLNLFNEKEFADPKEVEALTNEFQDILSPQDIRRRITIPVHTANPVARPTLDSTTAKTIAERLDALHLSSLYQLLGYSEGAERASARVLLRKAEELYQTVSQSAIKDQQNTYKSELTGHAKVIFSSEEKRKQYDESLSQEKFVQLLQVIEESIKFSLHKEVNQVQTELFLDNAQKAGWNRQEALRKLRDYALSHGWLVYVPQNGTSKPKISCGNCRELNDITENFCTVCHQELFLACPDCGQRVSCEHNACGKCGFPVGNRYLVDAQLKEIQDALSKKDVFKAQKLLEDIKLCWKTKKPDQRTRKIEDVQQKIQQLNQEAQRTLAHVQHLQDQKKLFETKRFLSSSEAVILSNKQQLLNALQTDISQAQNMLRQAFMTGRSRDEQIHFCKQALLLCDDYQEARNLLATLPPEEPQQLQAKPRDTIVSLSWNASATSNVSYTVVRRPFVQPHSPKDGVVLATVTGLTYEDSHPDIGIPLYYAVFAEHVQVTSHQAATLSSPVLLLEDVAQVQVEVNNQQVKLSWLMPKHAASVAIVRKDRLRPQDVHDGILVAECEPGQTSIVDRQVQNEQVYYYALFARFKNHEGRLVTAPGVRLRAIPEAPPEFIHSLHIHVRQGTSLTEREIQLSWTPPSKGDALIIKSSQSLQQHEGKVLAENQLQTLGKRLEEQPGSVVDHHATSGIVYYTPIVLFNKMAYIGRSSRFAIVDDVYNVRWQNLGKVLRLQWDWPADCQEVMLLQNSQQWPQFEDTTSTRITVSRTTYDRLGYYDLSGLPNTQYSIAIVTLISQQGEQIPSQGVRICAQLADIMVISYELRRPTLFQRSFTLSITTQHAGQLPTLLLVGTRGQLPAKKKDGAILARIEAAPIDKNGRLIDLPAQMISPGMYCKLFLEESHLYQMVDIRHPHENNLRIR